METSLRISKSSIKEDFLQKPYDFSFFQGMRIIEHIFGIDTIAIKSYVTLSPASSDIQNVEMISLDKIKLTINLISIAGSQGPLPTPYTELVMDRLKQKDLGFNDFLDIFNHRLGLIYYKIYKNFTPGFDLCSPHKSLFGKSILALSGLNLSYHMVENVSKRVFLKYSGILWQQPRSAVGLEQILCDFFKVNAKIYSFQGKFMNIDSKDWSVIGINHKAKNNILGQTTILGKQAWIVSSHMIIEIGIFNESWIESFLKGGTAYSHLKAFVHHYCGENYTFDLHLLCRPSNPLQSRLKENTKLGWTSIIGKRSYDNRIIVHY